MGFSLEIDLSFSLFLDLKRVNVLNLFLHCHSLSKWSLDFITGFSFLSFYLFLLIGARSLQFFILNLIHWGFDFKIDNLTDHNNIEDKLDNTA